MVGFALWDADRAVVEPARSVMERTRAGLPHPRIAGRPGDPGGAPPVPGHPTALSMWEWPASCPPNQLVVTRLRRLPPSLVSTWRCRWYQVGDGVEDHVESELSDPAAVACEVDRLVPVRHSKLGDGGRQVVADRTDREGGPLGDLLHRAADGGQAQHVSLTGRQRRVAGPDGLGGELRV